MNDKSEQQLNEPDLVITQQVNQSQSNLKPSSVAPSPSMTKEVSDHLAFKRGEDPCKYLDCMYEDMSSMHAKMGHLMSHFKSFKDDLKIEAQEKEDLIREQEERLKDYEEKATGGGGLNSSTTKSFKMIGSGNSKHDKLESEMFNSKDIPIKQQFHDIVNGLKIKGEKFTDPDFKPVPESLIANWSDSSKRIRDIVEEWKQFKWIRSEQIPCLNKPDDGPIAIFKGKIEPSDIKQGRLSDSFFLSAISAIAEHPERIKKMFVEPKVLKEGIFGVKMYKNGEEQLVTCDNYFPCKNTRPVFTRANGNELWPLILEKIWAKTHGGYENMMSGQTYEVFHDLLGAPSFYYKTNVENIWQIIKDAEERNYITAATAIPEDAQGVNVEYQRLEELGIVSLMSYSILNVWEGEVSMEKDAQGKRVKKRDRVHEKLVKLQSPMVKFEWSGDWGDDSALWNSDIKKKLEFENDDKDGIFWMSLRDFQKCFVNVHVCKFIDNCKFSFYKKRENSNAYHLISIQVTQRGNKTFCVSQPDRSDFLDITNFKYSSCRFIIIKLLNKNDFDGGVKYIAGKLSHWEKDYYLECKNLEDGKYLAFVEFDWDHQIDVSKRLFTVSCYGREDVTYKDETGFHTKEKYLKLALQDKLNQTIENDEVEESGLHEQNFADQGAPNIKRYMDYSYYEGYLYIIVKNEDTEAIYYEEMEFDKFDYLTMCEPHKDQKFCITVGPGSTEIVLIKADRGCDFSPGHQLKNVYLGDIALRELAINKDWKQTRREGIYLYKAWHDNGFITLYINETKDEVLTEVIEYDLKGMEIEGLSGEKTVTVHVDPGQEQMIKLVNISIKGDIKRELNSSVKNKKVAPFKKKKEGESDIMSGTNNDLID